MSPTVLSPESLGLASPGMRPPDRSVERSSERSPEQSPVTPPDRPPGDDALRTALASQQLEMVLGHTRLGTLMATAFAVLLALSLRGVALQPWIIDLWLAAKIMVAAVRVGLSLRHARAGRPSGPQWRNATDRWLLIDGAVWGAAGLLLMSSPIPLASLVTAVLVCVCCVATFGLQHSRRSTAAYVTPILLLTTLGLFMRDDEFGFFSGTGLLMLLALVLATARGSQRRLAEGLELRLRAQALNAEKEEALKLAMRESAAKTQFMGNISHELRTPLHGILGVARLLHLEARDPALARRVELIEGSGMHLLGLINDLIEVARLDSGRFTVRCQRFDLADLLNTIAEVYSVRASESGLGFRMALHLPEPCWVQGDPARVRQVLHNLLGNAVKFTRRGRITLGASRDAASAQARFEVVDSGPGIEAADLQSIFDAFRQGGGRAARPLEGTGLGLFVARDIARAMGGDLVLQSELGVGTTSVFTAHLPDAPAVLPGDPAAPQGQEATAELRVLVAEDDDVNALIATAFLDHQGVQAERVRDGAQAVRHALRDINRPDLVLMDCRMPVMDGLAATREIRAQEQALGLPRVPIIALTADTCGQTHADCIAAGMDGFLSKPFTKEDLARLLQDLAPQPEALQTS